MRRAAWMALTALLAAGVAANPAATAPDPADRPFLLRVRPAMLAQSIEELAGQRVEVTGARAVGMFGPRALVIDSERGFAAAQEPRDRVLVLIDSGEIDVQPELLVGSTVRVTGVARSLLGMQVAAEVPWPAELDRKRIERLEIRAAVLATSIRTLEGIELTRRSAAGG